MQVGDRIMAQPDTFVPDMAISKSRGVCSVRPEYPGAVTYIHPSGRWYQVTFDNGIKECFFIDPEPEEVKRGRPPQPSGYHMGA
jgi:hypothetical protein